MDATQMISDSFLESDEEENEEESTNKRGRPLAKLCILKNEHIPETELPLFLGENVLGRDPNTCTLPLQSPSISKQHATICISIYRRGRCHSEVDTEALVWDLGSLNGTRKGRLKLTPNVRYALSESDSLVVADIPCQYVSCAADTASSQGGLTPVSRNSGVEARLPDASGEKGNDTSTGSKKCVSGGTEARMSLPALEDKRKTPVRPSCLSFEQTPTMPQGTLVPESDSDSDGERVGGADRRRKAVVSDSDSYKSSPTCSTFLSPTNKIVPESEDESPITPSISAKNRPHKCVSFSKDETDIDVGRQQLKENKAISIVDNSEKEEGREEERATLGGRKSEESGQHVPLKQEGNVSLTGEDELPVSTTAPFTDAIPAFNMDSDTDMEGEEDGVASAVPVTLNIYQQADQPSNTAQFHMDSDTDVDEDDDALDKVPKSVSSSADNAKPPHAVSVIQPEGITMDSDTDVDEDAAVSHTALKAKPVPFQSTHTPDSVSSAQPKYFHLDSDTDVDEEEEKEFGTINECSKIDETPTRVDIKPTGPESTTAAPRSLHLDSDTDDEVIPAPAISEPSAMSAVTESCTTADTGADLDILSDSDTDDKDYSPLVIPLAVTTLSFAPGTASEALQSDSDADTDVDESSMPSAGDRVKPANLCGDSDTDVEDKEVDFGGAVEGQIPSLRRENTPGSLAPLLQNCSTPIQLSEGEVEHMETQAFLSPSSGPLRRAVAPALLPRASSSCSDSQEDEDFAVAETQSFVLQTRDCHGDPSEDHTMDPTQAFGLESPGDEKGEQSGRGGSFQLGLSDSSHLPGQAQALAMESTQAFVSMDTQAYAAMSKADKTSSESDSNLEATQAYGVDEEPARCSVTAEKEGPIDLALEATQAYISESYCDSEDGTDKDKRKETATAETHSLDLPTSSTLAMAETQPMSAFEDGESLDKENPASSVLQIKSRSQNKTEEREEHGEAAQTQERPLNRALSIAETQPMSENEESDDEDSIPGPRKRKAKPLQLEEEQTQPLSSSELSLVETHPIHISVDETESIATSANKDSDKVDSIPGPRKRKAKHLWLEEKETETLTNSELSAIETQRMDAGENDEEDSMPGPRKRKARPLQLEEEETQTLTNSELSAVETQLMDTDEHGQSDEEDSIPCPRKRKARPLQLEEEETQTLTNSELSAGETQLMDTGEHGESDEEDSIPCPRKREAKPLQSEEEQTQSLISSEVSAVETQPMVVDADGESDEDSIPGPRKRRAKSLQIQVEETQPLTDSEASTTETPPLETKAGLQSQRGKGGQSEAGTTGISKRGTRARSRVQEEHAQCSEPPKRQTRGKNKALPTTRGRRGKPRPDESEEEEEVEQAKQAKGKKSMRQEKDDEEDLETEINEHAENNRPIEEHEEQRLGEEKDVTELRQQEREKMERERREVDERERKQEDRMHRREEEEKLERKVMEEQETMQAENAERLRLELQRAEKETIERKRKEKEEKERADRLQRDKEEQLERERKEKEEKERLEWEKAEIEKERLEREEKARTENERKEQEEKEIMETTKRELEERLERERKEQEHQARLESEAKESKVRERLEKEKQEKEAKEKQMNEPQVSKEEDNKPKVPARGQRAARRTTAAPCTAEPKQDSTTSINDDVPARRTRSRSNSSNSVSSERSASSVNAQESKWRGRGRGAKRTSDPPRAAIARSSNRRRTVAAEPTEQDSNDVAPQGLLSRSNSNNSLNSDMSSSSLSSQSRGRGGRQQERGRKTEAAPITAINSQNSAPKPATRGRKSRKAEELSNMVPQEDDKEKGDSQRASTTRGRQRANANGSEPAAVEEEDQCTNEESLTPKRNIRGRGQKAGKSETLEAPATPAVSDGGEGQEKIEGRKRELEANREKDSSSSSKISKEKERAQTAEAAEDTAKVQTKDEIPVQGNRRGRASSAQTKKNAKNSPAEVKVEEENEKMEEEAVEKRGRGRPSAVQKKRKEEQEGSGTSVDQDAQAEASEPQTPTSSVSRKRQAPVRYSPVAKTPRSSSASPAASVRLRAAGQAYKVLFTGVVDEAGERVVARLGGSMAKGVADMNCLVTDKVRRTVKFLCAVAKGVPIVTTHWLEKSGKAGSFLSANAFVVKDPEQEKKFNFCLQESLTVASSQPLLQGYEIHVTKSVKPDPVQMKDIITCSGANFLAKMPFSHKLQTVVISCEEDWPLCGPALSAALPVVTAEFILTGILQQKVDFQTHSLSGPTSNLQPAVGRGRGRKKT